MPELWMPGAKKIDLGDHAPCDPNLPPKALAHITADRNATISKPQPWVPHGTLESFFRNSGRPSAPHILWSPFTGQFTQFVPANSRSKSLRDLPGGIKTNRAGKVVIQVEAVYFPYCVYKGKTYARLSDTPCLGWDDLESWITSWGVLKRWPGGIPTKLARDTHANFANEGGWYAHAQVPENDHVDPGSWPVFSGAVKPPTKPIPTPTKVPAFPGRQYFQVGDRNKYVTMVDNQLIRLGFTRYHDGNGYQAGPYYSNFTKKNVAEFQKSRGWSGSDADGLVGPQTWTLLHSLKRS